MMNEYAKRLGLKGTHYVNSWGGPDANHYSTAARHRHAGQCADPRFPRVLQVVLAA